MTTTWTQLPNPQPSVGWFIGLGFEVIGIEAVHIPNSLQQNYFYQQGSLQEGPLYKVDFDVSGTTGTVDVYLGGNLLGVYAAGIGHVSTTAQWQSWTTNDPFAFGFDVKVLGSADTDDFNGGISNIVVQLVSSPVGNLISNNRYVVGWTDVLKPSGTSYTDVPKPSNGNTVIYAGTPIGLLLALTYAKDIVMGGNWTNVAENGASWTKISGHSASWTNIPKAT